MFCETRYFNKEDTYHGKGFIEIAKNRPVFGKYVYSGKSGFCNIRVLENNYEDEDHPLNKKFWDDKDCVTIDFDTLIEKGMNIYETYPTFPHLTNKLVLRENDWPAYLPEFCVEDNFEWMEYEELWLRKPCLECCHKAIETYFDIKMKEKI